ncbi:uncharacterized protein [Typha angustifolia]|uniref:uncharacterized protein n=1 Tax=Typha angustifolia TaxID=59011 RepID=UPI003C2B60C0
MLSFINKYLRRPPRESGRSKEEQEASNKAEMLSTCVRDSSHGCAPGCCPANFLSPIELNNQTGRSTRVPATTTMISRSNFTKSTTSSILPNIFFTNHESLPSLPDAFSSFAAAFPQYGNTEQAERIRSSEYQHLLNHVCLDYAGFGLFSHAQMTSSVASTSSTPPPSSLLQPPFFSISYKSESLKSHMQRGSRETALESAIKKRIMGSLNISYEEYNMVCTANRTTAFRLLAETYPFHSNKRLLTVYDYESEAATAMAESAQRRGAKVMSANFTWPSLRIYSAKLREKLIKRKKKRNGLFVFPLQSRMTGARYPYLWMSLAQENGWHIMLDACALGPKDVDTFGLSLIQPDFIICNFYKVFGENPSGFAALFVKKSRCEVLQTSTIARSIGIVSIVPARRLSLLRDDYSSTDLESRSCEFKNVEDDLETTSSFSGPISTHLSNAPAQTENESHLNSKEKQVLRSEQGETSGISEPMTNNKEERGEPSSEIVEDADNSMQIECRGLDHADHLGLILIGSRLRCITNWLYVALFKLRHPHSESGHSLVKIYGPRVKFDRGPALAFNVFDWKGEKVEPSLVQKLADRSNISLSCGFLKNICFPDKYEEESNIVLERRASDATIAGSKGKENIEMGINVVNASLGFLTNFEDAYRLWAFIAKFLDADFIEKERWRYMALNQKIIEV